MSAFALITAAPALAQGSLDPITLPNGFAITPTAAPHSVLHLLNPGLPTLPNYVAGQAVSTALSPDGTQLLVLTRDKPRFFRFPTHSASWHGIRAARRR
jgi:hypothetical protein